MIAFREYHRVADEMGRFSPLRHIDPRDLLAQCGYLYTPIMEHVEQEPLAPLVRTHLDLGQQRGQGRQGEQQEHDPAMEKPHGGNIG